MIFILNYGDCGYIHAMDDEQYKLITTLVKNNGNFEIPAHERTKIQRSAYVKYWRLKEKLSVNSNGMLLYENKQVCRKGQIKKIVLKAFRKSKSAGCQKLQSRAADGYAGVSRRKILKVTSTNAELKKFNVKFTNKAVPKPVVANKVRFLYLFSN